MKQIILLGLLFLSISLNAQKRVPQTQIANPKNYQALKWRNIGPFRGGRSLAVSGVVGEPNIYYFGAVGGGVWKSEDAGANWTCVSDSNFKSSSVGAIAVSPSNKNIVFVGMGEADIRSNISFGDGIYKSTNAGKSWKNMGLNKADGISSIQFHPKNSDIVFVAALGNPFGKNPERGIYRTKDGGKNWQLVLAQNDSTGAADVKIDVQNPDIIYASTWQAYRNNYMMSSGGPQSGIFKSIDGGETWTDLSKKPGMPLGLLGKIGLAVSPINSDRVWAMVENADKGGLYRSDDGGENWTLVNDDKNLRQRPWYYNMIHADPKNVDGLMVTNLNPWRTKDGGKTFKRINVGHGDTHDIWWNPENTENFIVGDDGGAEVTFNGGATFSELDIPTAQFYHVSLDNDYPYNVYGAQQDNSSIRIASRTFNYSIGKNDWYPVAGGEAGYILADPLNNDITYGGEYDGSFSKYTKSINESQDVSVYPESNIGFGASEKKYRFQWTYPIVFSKHDPKQIFVTSQFVHTSSDGGNSWETISPDLTTNDKTKQIRSGGPITKDNTGAEIFCTIFSFAESAIKKGNYWAGTDDGLIQFSGDAGKNWTLMNTKAIPSQALISIIETSAFDENTVYVALNRYKIGDRSPFIFKTTDGGKTWVNKVKGIPSDEYVRVVREDPNKKGLLYAGTERGIWVSFNDGEEWQKLNLNLPITPVHDIQIHKEMKDVVIATHGRAFWILDDITPLYDAAVAQQNTSTKLIKPAAAFLSRIEYSNTKTAGQNPENGVNIRYLLENNSKEEISLIFMNAKGDTINTISSLKDLAGEEKKVENKFYQDEKKENKNFLTANQGLNSFTWNLCYDEPLNVKGTNILWNGLGSSRKVVPGIYAVKMLIGKKQVGEETFEVKRNPKMKCTDADLVEQFDLLTKVNANITKIHTSINSLRKMKEQLNGFLGKLSDSAQVKTLKLLTEPMIKTLDEVESKLMQPKALAPQDVLALPIQINDKFGGLSNSIGSAESKPTKQAYQVFNDLSAQMDEQLAKLNKVLGIDLDIFNAKVAEMKIPAILK